MYNENLLEMVTKLQQAQKRPIQSTQDIPYRGKTKGQFACRKFSQCTPRHNRTKNSFEENERYLQELDNDPVWKL